MEHHLSVTARFGFASGVAAFAASWTFFASSLLNMLGRLDDPWDVLLLAGTSLAMAVFFLMQSASVHAWVPRGQGPWSVLGLSFAVVYTVLAAIVYVTWMFAPTPEEAFAFGPQSFIYMLDATCYAFSGLAALMSSRAFTGDGLARVVRVFGIASGLAAVPVFLSYVFNDIWLGVGWQLTVPTYALLAALHMRERERAASSVPISDAI
ncbi:MAG: hypothetical protein JNN03_18035 [Rubrivivax sp.]|nr:hypothetical protein [Rubrivivax sp.]